MFNYRDFIKFVDIIFVKSKCFFMIYYFHHQTKHKLNRIDLLWNQLHENTKLRKCCLKQNQCESLIK